jgi:uncharacterized membrane protein
VRSAPETQWRERTGLARQRSALAFTLIGALLLTHSHALLGVSASLIVVAVGWGARSERTLVIATVFAAVCAAVIVVA